MFRIFLRFLEKRPLTVKSVPNVFIASSIDMLCANYVKLGGRKIGEIVRYLPDKKNKILPDCTVVAILRGSRPKS